MMLAFATSVVATVISSRLLMKKISTSGWVNKLIFCSAGVLAATIFPVLLYTAIDLFFAPVNGSALPGMVGQGIWIGIIVSLFITRKKHS